MFDSRSDLDTHPPDPPDPPPPRHTLLPLPSLSPPLLLAPAPLSCSSSSAPPATFSCAPLYPSLPLSRPLPPSLPLDLFRPPPPQSPSPPSRSISLPRYCVADCSPNRRDEARTAHVLPLRLGASRCPIPASEEPERLLPCPVLRPHCPSSAPRRPRPLSCLSPRCGSGHPSRTPPTSMPPSTPPAPLPPPPSLWPLTHATCLRPHALGASNIRAGTSHATYPPPLPPRNRQPRLQTTATIPRPPSPPPLSRPVPPPPRPPSQAPAHSAPHPHRLPLRRTHP